MGTIHQPTPSNPGSPQPDQQPLQPGGVERSRSNEVRESAPNPRTPEQSESEMHRGDKHE
ncbi:MAG: hypothetical protein ACTHQM_10705 [Thermoanaerobaculia bacterium]